MTRKKFELWDLYGADGTALGVTHQRGIPLRLGHYHPVVSIFTVNSKGEILLTKRHPEKSSGSCFEATGGCITAGGEPLSSALRELFEETGIRTERLLTLSKDMIELPGDPVICWSYLLYTDIDIRDLTLQQEEVTEALWASPKLLDALIPCGSIEPCTAWLWEKYKDRILNSIESWNDNA